MEATKKIFTSPALQPFPLSSDFDKDLAFTPPTEYFIAMKTHAELDQRSFVLARAVADEIDRDPERRGLQKARETCARWFRDTPAPAMAEWLAILNQEWDQVRAVLLTESEQGQRLRQSNPFCGILSPRTRWEIYRRFSADGGSASGMNP